MHKFIKYSFITVVWILISITAIIILALGFIQTSLFREKLISLIETKAPQYINGRLTIGKIEGDFFTHLVLKDILLVNVSDTILYIPEAKVSYDLFPLLHKKLDIENFKIHSPYINLSQINDSTWNIQQIVKSTQHGETGTVSTGKSFDINLTSLEISNGNVNIHSPDTIIPRQVQKINSALSFSVVNKKLSLQLKGLSLLTRSPDLEIREMTLHLDLNPDSVKINDFALETAKNHLDGRVAYFSDKGKKSTVELKTTPLQLDEFKYYLSGFKTSVCPLLYLGGSMRDDSVKVSVNLSDQKQNVQLNLLSPNLYRWLTEKSDSILIYQLKVKLENLKISHWMDLPRLNYILNGDFTANGRGTDIKTAEVKLTGNFDNLIIENRKIDLIHLDGGYNKGNMKGIVQGKGNFGNFSLTADIKNLLKKPHYQLVLITKDLDIAPLTGMDTLNSAINMTADVKGEGFDPNTLSAYAAIDMKESRIQKVDVNTMKVLARYQKENLDIDSVGLQTRTLTLKAKGNYSLKSVSGLSLTADLQNMDEFSSFIPLRDLQTSGHLEVHIAGKRDSLNIEANLDLPQTKYGEYLVGPVHTLAHGKITPTDKIVSARILAKDLNSGDFKLDSASFNVEAANDSADIKGHFVNKDLDTRFQSTLHLGELLTINLRELAVKYKNQLWRLDHPPSVLEISTKNYKIGNFSLSNNRGDTIQSITAEGNINREGKEDFDLDIKNIDIKRLLELTNQKISASGILNLNINLKGTSGFPLLKSNITVNQAVVNGFPLTELDGTFDYKSDRMQMGMRILPRDSGKFELTGTVPLRLNLDSMDFSFNKKDSVDISLIVERFPLAAIKSVDIVKQITGNIEGRVQMRGSVESPDLRGNLELKNASVKLPEYGIDYRDILFNASFLRDKLRLDTIRIRTDKGSLTGTGELNFSSEFYKGNISSSEITLKFSGFKPINHREVNMEVSGKTSLVGTKGNVVFNGDLEVTKSEIYLPALFNMLGKANTPEISKPLLVQALDSTSGRMDTLVINKVDMAKADTSRLDYFKNLKGKLRLKIPKNAWIKNENMYVEISGDLELLKEHEFFELFGNVDVVRGQYELLGRKFVIDKGILNFEGGERMMPKLGIQASYSFRNTQGITQKLSVDIQGFPDSLALNFTLDNSSINEGDALSYILFGRSMNELTLDQQQGIAGSGGSMAEQVAASLVSSQLTKLLGSKLNVDYLEIKSEGGFENASLTVGKYITKDLFASYEQQFGQTDIKGIPSYQLNLEYQILKFLFLRMNNSSIDNGFDVIFKLEGK